jgi:hypothetical protein
MSNLSDVVGGANMYNGTNYTFDYDRLCKAYSAIRFSSGYLQVPPGIYFSGEFTITAWIYLLPQQTQSSRIIDFGNGPGSNNILFAITGLSVHIYRNSSFLPTGSTSLNLTKWYHVAFVLNGINGSVYVNGYLARSAVLHTPVVLTRNLNYIGKSNWATGKNAYAIFDDLKIYQGALSETQILDDFKLSSNNGLLKNFNINKI